MDTLSLRGSNRLHIHTNYFHSTHQSCLLLASRYIPHKEQHLQRTVANLSLMGLVHHPQPQNKGTVRSPRCASPFWLCWAFWAASAFVRSRGAFLRPSLLVPPEAGYLTAHSRLGLRAQSQENKKNKLFCGFRMVFFHSLVGFDPPRGVLGGCCAARAGGD